MCIIVAKPKDIQLPEESVFKNCWYNNPDGAGIMYVKNGLVTIQKGLMTYEAFKGTLEKLKRSMDTTQVPMVFHFRIATHGKVNAENTHPFPISDDEDLLQKKRLKTRIGVAHNGIITLAERSQTSSLSDTQVFIRDYLSLIAQDPKFYKRPGMLTLIERLIKSKMSILSADGDLVNIGMFEESKGCYFSNNSYLDDYGWDYSGGLYSYGSYSDKKFSTIYYTKRLMWLDDEHYIIKDNDFVPLDSFLYLMDNMGLLYIYDYTEDVAYYYSCDTVYDSNIQPVKYDISKAEWLTVTTKKYKKDKIKEA
jgi:predicted glutamine amidotransferase